MFSKIASLIIEMGIAERKERDRLELREKILNAATELFLEQGYEKTSIRNIANAIEYSPATIYLHFKDKDELFYLIAERAFDDFYEHLKAASTIEPPIDRLRQMGLNYIKFAFENPGYYNVMFILEAPMRTVHTEDQWSSGDHAHGYLVQTVIACQETGYFKGRNSEAVALMIWSFMHGIVSLKLRDRMKTYTEEQTIQMIFGTFQTFNEFLRLDADS